MKKSSATPAAVSAAIQSCGKHMQKLLMNKICYRIWIMCFNKFNEKGIFKYACKFHLKLHNIFHLHAKIKILMDFMVDLEMKYLTYGQDFFCTLVQEP